LGFIEIIYRGRNVRARLPGVADKTCTTGFWKLSSWSAETE